LQQVEKVGYRRDKKKVTPTTKEVGSNEKEADVTTLAPASNRAPIITMPNSLPTTPTNKR